MTGMRIGEMAGLFWSDIEWRADTIRVERTLTRASRETYHAVFCNVQWIWSTLFAVVPPESKKGRRTMTMPELLAAILRRVHAAAPNRESPYVFQDGPGGGPIHPENVRARLWEAQDRLCVKRFTPHA